MSTVLAVHTTADPDQHLTDVATAIAALVGADAGNLDLDASEPERQADRVLAALADKDTVLVVLSMAEPAQDLCWHVLRRAGKPVILVPAAGGHWNKRIGRALVPLDGTRESAIAVEQTIRLLSHAGVDLVVLHVFDASTVPKFWDHPGHAEQVWQQEFLARYCAHSGVRLRLRSGVPGEHVLDVAATEQVDLIALGWSQRWREGQAKTLRRTLRDARVPVLVVPIPLAGGPLPLAAQPPEASG